MLRRIFSFLLLITIPFLFINADSTTSATKIPHPDLEKTKPIEKIEASKETATIPDEKPAVEEPIETKIEKVTEKIKEKKTIEEPSTPITIEDEEFARISRKQQSKRKSNMILFEETVSPSSTNFFEEMDENISTEKVPWYSSKKFIPEDIDQFIQAAPKYHYDRNDIILSGYNKINRDLGEKVFLKAYESYRTNDIKNSQLLFEKLVHYNYRISEAYYYLSWCRYLKRDYIKAINYMKKAINESSPINIDNAVISDYIYQIGNIYFKLENYGKAIEYFKKALEKYPALYKSYNRLGISYYKIGELQKALESWEIGMKGEDKNSEKNYNWLKKKLAD